MLHDLNVDLTYTRESRLRICVTYMYNRTLLDVARTTWARLATNATPCGDPTPSRARSRAAIQSSAAGDA